MFTTDQRLRRLPRAPVGTLAAAALSLALSGFAVEPVLDVHNALPDLDTRVGSLPPSGAALAIVSGLGARAEWNRFGTPSSVVKHGGYLATGLSGSPTTAARNWIRANKALFKLSDAGVDALEMINDSKTAGNDGHVVIFRQKFGSLSSGTDGLVTVAIRSGKIAYVSSSSAGDQPPPGPATIPATTAWINAAIEIGRVVSPSAIANVRTENSWTVFDVDGFSYFQRARLVAFPTLTQGVRPAFECNVVDNQDGVLSGYTSFVDAQTGQVLMRQNRVNQIANLPVFAQVANTRTFPFTGAYVPPACSTPLSGPFTAVPGDKRIDVVATSANPANDIVINLYYDHDGLPATPPQFVQAQDLLTSPEHLMYVPPDPPGVPPGNYFVEICPFVANQEADNFAAAIIFSDASANQFPYPPHWKVFPANPPLNLSSTDTRKIWCWETVAGCDAVHPQKHELFNLAARGPWDHLFTANAPSFRTIGNAAVTSEAWLAAVGPPQVFGGPVALGPGPTGYTPFSEDRKYSEQSSTPIQAWANQWASSGCSPLNFATPQANDRDAVTIHLFSMHNRMHDWSYFLGFTEKNFNLQDNNFGNTAPGAFPTGREKDPEMGFAQCGAISGSFGPNPQTSGGGRNNANQLTLQDGVPGLTNQYLFQPLGGGWYGPCADGALDMSIVAHEYTHAISNRMIAGPDSGITGHQGGAMGESWSDLVAVEYLNEYGFVPTAGENPFSVGAYATGNPIRAIRNYGMNLSPLNYSDVGYDISGPQVHADGEIWSAANFDIRQLFIAKYNGSYPAGNMALQRKCADGLDTADHCPGNRRWIQIMFDAFLMMPSNVSYLSARDAYLAADLMRFGGANNKELWTAFSRRGMGKTATTNGNADTDPIPSFELPGAPECPSCGANATVHFKVVSMDEAQPGCTTGCNTELGRKPIAAKIFVGRYEARSNHIVLTIPNHTSPLVPIKFTPGTYDFLVVANGYGHFRFQRTFTAGQTATLIPWVRRNWASSAVIGGEQGVAAGDGTSLGALIDDTEATQWQRTGAPVLGSQVTVNLAGNSRTVSRVRVSALLFSPAGEQPRLTALRQFEVYTCTASAPNSNCTAPPLGFTKIYTSPADAFPGVRPRPAAPDLILREFSVPSTSATHVQIRVLTNQCTGNPQYQGDQDMDPNPWANSDCIGGMTPRGNDVRIAEFQVVSGGGAVGVPGDPLVTLEMAAPLTAAPGATITYDLTYTNFGPEPSTSATITDVLPSSLTFVSATGPATYNASTRTVTWNLGTVPVLYTGTVQLKVKVPVATPIGTAIPNQAEFRGALTVSPPTAAAVTLVLP